MIETWHDAAILFIAAMVGASVGQLALLLGIVLWEQWQGWRRHGWLLFRRNVPPK